MAARQCANTSNDTLQCPTPVVTGWVDPLTGVVAARSATVIDLFRASVILAPN
jgi:hypothetical protein